MNKKTDYFLLAGLIFFVGLFIIYLNIGQNIYVLYHDQLDSEVSYYMLKAKSISLIGQSTFQEFMNGNAVIEVASPFQLLYYLLFPPVYAFIVNLFVVRIVAFVSMYLLAKRLSICHSSCFLISFFYAILPFYSTYGLNIMGIPLIIICMANLFENRYHFLSLLGIAFFALYSSLVLIGYMVVAVISIYIVLRLIKGKKNPKEVYFGVILLISIYCITSKNLIFSLGQKSEFVSHRIEMIPKPKNFWKSFTELLFTGHYHSVSLHKAFWLIILLFFISLCMKKKKNISDTEGEKCRIAIFLFIFAVFIAFFYAAFNSEIGVRLRTKIFGESVLRSFQFDRIYWLYPFIWYLMAVLMASFFVKTLLSCELVKKLFQNKLHGICKLLVKHATAITSGLLLFFMCFKNIGSSDIYINLTKNDNYNSGYISWRSFYATDVFDAIKDYIGDDTSMYHVVSVGLYPSIALYNGFYCLDGYSQNYDVKYKHSFYEVIKNELKGDIKPYFLEWGNRCYMFSSSQNFDYISKSKEKRKIKCDYELNNLKKIGCTYILSRYKLADYNEKELKFLEYFDSCDSCYGVFLYKIL